VFEVLKSILYLLGGVLTLPGALLACFIWSVSEAARQKGLFQLLFFVLKRTVDLMDWTLWIIIPSLLAWLILAFFVKFRVYGAAPMAMIALVSLIVMLATNPPKSAGDLFFPILSLAGLLINFWLIWDAMAASTAGK
jgi:hypothetical protein